MAAGPRGWFPLHVTSTNVPGPRQPLYLGEHELLHWYPFGVQWTNNALFLCTLSYREHLVLGPVADPELVDVWEFAADLRAAYDDIRRAAGILVPDQAEDQTGGQIEDQYGDQSGAQLDHRAPDGGGPASGPADRVVAAR